MSATPLSPAHRLRSLHVRSALEANTTERPSALIAGDMLAPGRELPSAATSTRVTVPDARLTRKIPLAGPGTRSVAADWNATVVPAASMAGPRLGPLPGTPPAVTVNTRG